MAKAYLVIRIKGQADVPYWANTTLRLLKLEKKYRATILPVKENTDGMLKKIQQFVSWQEIDTPTTKELLDKKGRRSGYKKITTEDISKAGFKTIDELATSLSEGKIRNLLKLAGLKDAWTTAKGSTTTMNSTSKAVLNCLRQTFSQG